MVLSKTKVNTITAILLFIFNLIMLILDKSKGMYRYINLMIPVLAFVFIFILKNKNFYIFYMIIGILITGLTSQANFSGAVMFFIAMYDNKSNRNIRINIVFIFLSLCLNTYKSGYLDAHIFSMVIAFIFVFFHMYVRFWSSPVVNTHECEKKGYTREQRETIEMLQLGLKHKDAAERLNISRSAYSDRVATLRARYGVKDDFQLALALVDDNIISVNTPTVVEKVKNEITKVI